MFYFVLPTKDCHVQSSDDHLQGLSHSPLDLLTFNTLGKNSGQRSGMRHSVLWENWWNRPLDSYIFKRKFNESQLLHLLTLRKALKPLTTGVITPSCSFLHISWQAKPSSPQMCHYTYQRTSSWRLLESCYRCSVEGSRS